MFLIKNCRLIDPASGTDAVKDILINDKTGLIEAITAPAEAIDPDLVCTGGGTADTAAAAVYDAEGLIAAPGLVDTHTHFRDPGFPLKEDISSGSRSAAAGGYTSIIMMANTNPPIDSVEVLTDVLTRGAKEKIHIYSAANVTSSMAGKELSDLKALAAAGARVFTDDGKPILDGELLRSALLEADKIGLPVSLHEEDPAYISQNGIHGGSYAAKALGLEGSPREAEISMIRRDVEIAVETGAALLIQHISTAEGVDLVRKAKAKNPRIAAEATPHHFALTEEAVVRCGSAAKVNPPIRTEADRQAIIDGLCDGTIAIIATDHAPHTAEEKAVQPMYKAPSGMIGLETALSLAIRELVDSGRMSMSDMLALFTCRPADYYKLPAGRIFEGGPADIVLFDPEAKWTVPETFASRSCNSPFIGETLPGVIRATICAGKVVYKK